MKNVLITGANGQLGTELGKIMPAAILTAHSDLDITDKSAVDDFVRKNQVDTIVNCAAYTAVDAAEDDYVNARKINSDGPYNLAKTGCKIIQISTDYVFDGIRTAKNLNGCKTDAVPNPQSVYGWTKRMGETAVLNNNKNGIVIRTSWLYSPYGKNFVKTMRNLGANKPEISVVDDQFGSPTYAADLAAAIVQIIPQMTEKNAGIYHYSNDGFATWCTFAREIMNFSGLKCRVNRIYSHQYPTRAVRPKWSVLDTSKTKQTFGIKIPDWRNALNRCIIEIERQ